jgi:hypothetical protein
VTTTEMAGARGVRAGGIDGLPDGALKGGARATTTRPPAIAAAGLRKSFGDRVVLDGIDPHVPYFRQSAVIPARYARRRQTTAGAAPIGQSCIGRHEMSAMLLTDLTIRTDPGLPEFFLGRLASLVARHLATVSPTERKALREAILSVYLDCLDLGLGGEAQAIVEPLRHQAGPADRLAA